MAKKRTFIRQEAPESMFQPQNALKHYDSESFDDKINKRRKLEKLTVDQAKTAGGDTLFGE